MLIMNIPSSIKLSANSKIELKQLPPSENVGAVRAAPKETTRLERRYLEALQKNVTAQNEYNMLLQKAALRPNSRDLEVQRPCLSEHIKLLRLKKRHEELHTLQRYMTRLKNTPAAKPDFLDLKSIRRNELDSFSSGYQHCSGGIRQAEDFIGTLIKRLEMTVIRAKHLVDREHMLLTKVEENFVDIPVSVKQKNRLCALAATRDELVAWIEEKLSSSRLNEKSMVDNELQERQTESHIPELQFGIMEKYYKYIKIRRTMLALMSDLVTSTKQPPSEVEASGSKRNSPIPSTQTPSPSYLPFILTQIDHPTKVHQLHRQQTTYLATLIKKERSKAAAELSCLAEESHLLPAYPMLAQQEQFKHATNFNASSPLPGSALTSPEENEMIRTLETWAFAADAAREATEKIVTGHIEQGSEAVVKGQRWVGKLQELFSNDGEVEQESVESGDADIDPADVDDDGDMWDVKAAVGSLGSRKLAVMGTKGPWAGVQGDVGLRKNI